MADRAAAGAAVPGDLRDRLQSFFLDAARALMVFGAIGVVANAGSPGGGGNAMQAFMCLLLWLLGLCFLALAPAAGRFPRAALAAAAVVETVLKHFFTLELA